MGLLEFHFHDCEFSPSMTVGGEAEDESGESAAETADTEDSPASFGDKSASDRSGSDKSGVGALLALALLVVLGALVKWKRGGSGAIDDDEGGETQDVEVSA
jgi:hypothetical protein